MALKQSIANMLMDCLACVQYCGQQQVNEEEIRKMFVNICDYFGVTKVKREV